MKLRDYICLLSALLLFGCLVGMVLTFKTDNALCARFYLWSLVFGTAFCLSGFKMKHGGKH